MNAPAGALIEIFGPDDFSERLQRRRSTLDAVERTLLKREIFVARAG